MDLGGACRTAGAALVAATRGPVRARHPARDTVADLDLPLVNTVPAS